MKYQQVMRELKSLGSPQAVKIYKRHGATNVFGIKFADLYKVQKKIGIDHALAQQLMASSNEEAHILGALIADSQKLTKREAKKWIHGVKYYLVSNYLGGLYAKTPFATSLMEEFMTSKKEVVKHNGYDILSTILKNGSPIRTDKQCLKYLKAIEKEIHSSPNRAKNGMNNALIALGVYRPSIRKEVLAAAKRIGPVDVDHGDTSCKTNYAPDYIKKAVAHQKNTKS